MLAIEAFLEASWGVPFEEEALSELPVLPEARLGLFDRLCALLVAVCSTVSLKNAHAAM